MSIDISQRLQMLAWFSDGRSLKKKKKKKEAHLLNYKVYKVKSLVKFGDIWAGSLAISFGVISLADAVISLSGE